MIDWTNPKYPVTKHFNVSDCLMLHAWNRLADATDGVDDAAKEKLIILCNKMEEVRAVLGCAMNVHCTFRSPDYNTQVVGAKPHDVHSTFEAMDFDCNPTYTIDEVQSILEPILEQLGIRMERNTKSWIHLDLHPVGNARYFLA